ncbi:MAG TPA: flagellar protein FlgN [Capillibacterium sp.]
MSTGKVLERMAEEINLLRQLVDLASAKKEALVKNDLEALKGIMAEEEETLAVMERLQGAGGNETEAGAEVQEMMEERAALLARLKEINLLNQQLLEDALTVIGYSLRLILGEDENNLYGSSGEVKAVGSQSVFNWRG